MDYIKFTKDLEAYDEWNRINAAEMVDNNIKDTLSFTDLDGPHSKNDNWLDFGTNHRVHSPSHYTSGKQEVIDVIEDTIKSAPDPVQGMLQAQVLKYLMRVWLKDNPLEDARKAQWYLTRLIEKMR